MHSIMCKLFVTGLCFFKLKNFFIHTNRTSFCTIIPNDVGMFGVYNIEINDDNCNYEVTSHPVNVNLCKFLYQQHTITLIFIFNNFFPALLFALLILFFALFLIYGSNRYYMRYKRSRQSTSETNLETEEEKPKTTKPRLRSLDTFRGYESI